MQEEKTTFESYLEKALSKQSESKLDEAEMNLLRLFRLLIDVKYERKYGAPLEELMNRRYIQSTT